MYEFMLMQTCPNESDLRYRCNILSNKFIKNDRVQNMAHIGEYAFGFKYEFEEMRVDVYFHDCQLIYQPCVHYLGTSKLGL